MILAFLQPANNIFKLGFKFRSGSLQKLVFLSMFLNICVQHRFSIEVCPELKFVETQGKRISKVRVLCPVGVKLFHASASHSGHHR